MTNPTCTYLAACCRSYERARERVDALWADLTPAQLTWKPSPERWSVAECVEHLNKTMATALGRIRPAMERARAKARTGGEPPYGRGTWLGRLILGLMDPDRAKPRRFKAPKLFRPAFATDVDPERVAETFRCTNDDLIQAATDADGLDLGRIRVGSPVSGWIRFSLAQAFRLQDVHHHRHLDQADRVRREPGFPSATP
ncbi:MAG: DinB family protein [Planctomycetota bacterium]|jgi:hypothetical protein